MKENFDGYEVFDPYEARDRQVEILDADLSSGLITEEEHRRAVSLLDRWLDDFDQIL